MKINSKTIFIISFCVITLTFIFICWWGIYSPKNPNLEKEVIFSVEKGEGSKEIAINLKKEGLIRSTTIFRLYVLTVGKSGKLQAGDYVLSFKMTPAQIAHKMATGDIIKDRITIVEGWNLRDIAWFFENKGMFQAEELFELVGFPLIDYSKETEMPFPKDFSQEFSFLADKPGNLSLEGYLFPDTYEVRRGDSLEDIVIKILKNLDKKLSSGLRQEISAQNKSIFEVLTVASMIEKEVNTLEDKKIVSGILWKRLENSFPLQIDATISYITGKKSTKISIAETKTDSPYNTYKYKGLPLGPISNPGLESIEAAVYPEKSDFWYYLSTPEGETIFSKTLDGHNDAKAKYLR